MTQHYNLKYNTDWNGNTHFNLHKKNLLLLCHRSHVENMCLIAERNNYYEEVEKDDDADDIL